MGNETLNAMDAKTIGALVDRIKKDVLSARNRLLSDANKELSFLYLKIGKAISENQRYGSNFINTLSALLKNEFPSFRGFSPRNLARMRRYYEAYGDPSNLPIALAKLPWSFSCLLIDKVKEKGKRLWYAEKCIENGWSHAVLDHQIDSSLFERQAHDGAKLSNYGSRLAPLQSELAVGMMKDPYVFELVGMKEKVVEKDVENLMLENVKSVLLEMGKGFSFLGSQYMVSTPNNDYYIDLLFYHVILKSYVAVELKTTDFRPEFLGQLQFYVTALDETLKRAEDNPSIGLLLCKGKDRVAVEWALKSSGAPLGVASYEIRSHLPSEREIAERLESGEQTKQRGLGRKNRQLFSGN